MILKVVEFIKSNPDWESKLKEAPHSLIIKRNGNLISFQYNQIESDMSLELIQQCRGLILRDETFDVVCCPFFKFFNYGEGCASSIDWNSARVEEKIDGSILKFFYFEGAWRVATNGLIDAREANLPSDVEVEYKTFRDLFDVAWNKTGISVDSLNKDYTYIFELTSPFNRVVVSYPDTEIAHIGTRNNKTLEELNVDIGIRKPKIYSFSTFEDAVENAKALPFQQEGYVVVDGNWNRVKCKSLNYLSLHHLKGNGNVLLKHRILELIMKNEQSEVLNYFPEYKKYFDEVELIYNKFMKEIEWDIRYAMKTVFPTRKDYAMWAKDKRYSPILFSFYDKKIDLDNFKSYFDKVPSDKLIDIISN